MPLITHQPATPAPISYDIPTRENFKVDFIDSRANKTVTITKIWGSSPEVPGFVLWKARPISRRATTPRPRLNKPRGIISIANRRRL